ncbi:relaxase/mobilization nuclease domain-containing protein [Vibrio renipiscarius]|uniref:MobA/VirD2-like nuclease domain-containing protein n=1 Tax=Vibrio renipiscarius TaxID=1461322 RepID=A0A0C2NXT2_9VIBR|nr:hypothetical protein [Vibrio renipiscarius]KII79441.1 hypothetical protein PL18_07165 [Vibrio renipiscarius]KII80930.1 hypothetical protein OJ16_06500 [Vibrio renipiscarius]
MIITEESKITTRISLNRLIAYIVNPKQGKTIQSENLNVLGQKERISYAFTNQGFYHDVEAMKLSFAKQQELILANYAEYEAQMKKKSKKAGANIVEHIEICPTPTDFLSFSKEELARISMEIMSEAIPEIYERPFICGLHQDTDKPHFHFVLPTVYRTDKGIVYDKGWKRRIALRKAIEKAEQKYGLSLTGENNEHTSNLSNDMNFAQSLMIGRHTAADLLKKAKAIEDPAMIERVRDEIKTKRNISKKSGYYDLTNIMRKIKTTPNLTAQQFSAVLAENNININFSFKLDNDGNKVVRGISYELVNEAGEITTALSATALSKTLKGKGKRRFELKNLRESIDDWTEFETKMAKYADIKPDHTRMSVGNTGFVDFKTILDIRFVKGKQQSVWRGFDKKTNEPLFDYNSKDKAITFLNTKSKDAAFKSMQLAKNWNGIVIKTSSSRWASYELEAWLKLDSDPKKTIKQFNFNTESKVQHINWADFHSAVKGLKFTDKEVVYIKQNLLSPQDFDKYSLEIEKLLVTSKPKALNSEFLSVVDDVLNEAMSQEQAVTNENIDTINTPIENTSPEQEDENEKEVEKQDKALKDDLISTLITKPEEDKKAEVAKKSEHDAILAKAASDRLKRIEEAKKKQDQVEKERLDAIEAAKPKPYNKGFFEVKAKDIAFVDNLLKENYLVDHLDLKKNVKASEIIALMVRTEEMDERNIAFFHKKLNERTDEDVMRQSFMTHAATCNPDYKAENVGLSSIENRWLEERTHKAKSVRGDFIVKSNVFNKKKTQGEIDKSRTFNRGNQEPSNTKKVKVTYSKNDINYEDLKF